MERRETASREREREREREKEKLRRGRVQDLRGGVENEAQEFEMAMQDSQRERQVRAGKKETI